MIILIIHEGWFGEARINDSLKGGQRAIVIFVIEYTVSKFKILDAHLCRP